MVFNCQGTVELATDISLGSCAVNVHHGPSSPLKMGCHSITWRSLVEDCDTLKQGPIKRISNGATTEIWQTNLIPRKENIRPLVALVADPPNLVSEPIDTTSARWNSELVQRVFLPYDASPIMQIPVCTGNIDDFWAWNFEKSGIFIVRSTYRMILETKKRREDSLDGHAGSSNNVSTEKSWETLWNVMVPAKLKVFLWRLARHSLLT
jgi:hypothetical protein